MVVLIVVVGDADGTVVIVNLFFLNFVLMVIIRGIVSLMWLCISVFILSVYSVQYVINPNSTVSNDNWLTFGLSYFTSPVRPS